MRLFPRKKQPLDDDAERCPRCRERVPEGAAECMMCGIGLAPFREADPERSLAPSGDGRTLSR
jgi:hypothetical protein